MYVPADCAAGILSPKYIELEELEATLINVFAAVGPSLLAAAYVIPEDGDQDVLLTPKLDGPDIQFPPYTYMYADALPEFVSTI